MILIEKPFASDLFLKLISEAKLPVVDTESGKEMASDYPINWQCEEDVVETDPDNGLKFYTNSENAIGWVAEHYPNSKLFKAIDAFKDKVLFRELIAPKYPNFRFRGIELSELQTVDLETLPFPCILKPAVGFFSLGVYIVNSKEEWDKAVSDVFEELDKVQSLFPSAVFDASKFIVEEIITGTEYAFDAYFNNEGKPVILNILKHEFSGDGDVSDRIYLTSEEIVRGKLEPFNQFLNDLSEVVELKNFPLHIEIRETENGEFIPIEVNPLRFGGFCTTADLTYHAYGVNSYKSFFNEEEPDWDEIFKVRKNKIFALVVLDNSTGIEGKDIQHFDYDLLKTKFTCPIEIRKMDYKKFPLFGFVFAETSVEKYGEIEYMLNSDLKEFV